MNPETMLRREAEEALRRVTEQLGEAMNRIEELEAKLADAEKKAEKMGWMKRADDRPRSWRVRP